MAGRPSLVVNRYSQSKVNAMRRYPVFLLAAVLLLSGNVMAQTPSTLVDAWGEALQSYQEAPFWSHAVVLRQESSEIAGTRGRRLVNELETLEASARLGGERALANGLGRWRQSVAEMDITQRRTPGRHDLPWLIAHLRQDLPLERIVHWGFCAPPDWVEVWALDGVHRIDWRHDLTLQQALAALPAAGHASADQATLITPPGARLPRGIADWNRQATPLAPGSRVVIELPQGQGLRGALPFPGTVEEARWLNQHLPDFLATRLPGDDCTLWNAE